MITASVKTSSFAASASIGARIDGLIGSLISVKPSVIAACFSSAMTASNTIGTDELSRVSPQQMHGARRAMGLDA